MLQFISALGIGLVAGFSSCMAVSGGLLLATAAKFNEKLAANSSRSARFVPVLLFVLGRLAAYAVLGGLVGELGQVLAPSPTVSGWLTLIAALFMLIIGLDLLHLLPRRLKLLLPRLPTALSRRVLKAESSVHPIAPLLLGAGTFFLPCGFTQAFQLAALSSGSFWAGASILGGFAIGTAPALLILGWFAGAFKGKAGRFIFSLAAIVIIILGLVNFWNGLNILGWTNIEESGSSSGAASQSSVPDDGQAQVVDMSIGPDGYSPDSITIRAGQPVHWVIDARAASGCQMSIVSRQLSLQKFLSAGVNTIDFIAPETPGRYQFSCSMGMYRGQFNVIANP